MLPVEADVAHQLERGYTDMKPWTQTYEDEVSSCLMIGPEAELKLVHRLWPSEEPDRVEGSEPARKTQVDGLFDNAAAGNTDTNDIERPPTRQYAKWSVIYADGKEAQILRPNLLPSVSRGRKPLGAIRKGRPIGVAVVRGFDHDVWDRLNPTKKGAGARKARAAAIASQSGVAATTDGREVCVACLGEQDKPQVTDLVFVIHGWVVRYAVTLVVTDHRCGPGLDRSFHKGWKVFTSLTPSIHSDGR